MNKSEFDAAVAAARAAASADWRARARAISSSPPGLRAPKAANDLIFTDMPTEAAIEQLANKPAETPEAIAAERVAAGWMAAAAAANLRTRDGLVDSSMTDDLDEPELPSAVHIVARLPPPRYVAPEARAKAGWSAAIEAANARLEAL